MEREYDGTLHSGDTLITFEGFEFINVAGIESYVNMFRFTVVENPRLKGDINGDSKINIIDVKLLLQSVIRSDSLNDLTNEEKYYYDINNDDAINIIDVKLLLQQVIRG